MKKALDCVCKFLLIFSFILAMFLNSFYIIKIHHDTAITREAVIILLTAIAQSLDSPKEEDKKDSPQSDSIEIEPAPKTLIL